MGFIVTYYRTQISPTLGNENDAWIWLLKNQGMSTDWALRYGGYAIVPATGAVGAPLAPIEPYFDRTHNEWVGEYATISPDGEVNRQTEWFPNRSAALRFCETGVK